MGFALLDATGSWVPHMAFGPHNHVTSNRQFAPDTASMTAQEQEANTMMGAVQARC